MAQFELSVISDVNSDSSVLLLNTWFILSRVCDMW